MLASLMLVAAFDLVAVAAPSAPEVAPPLPVFVVVRDGARLIAVERASTDPSRVHLVWPDGRDASARVSDFAIARFAETSRAADSALVTSRAADSALATSRPADPGQLASRYDLAVVAPLMARAGIHRVRSTRPGEDGLALAARLAADPSLDVLPDFAFARTAHKIHVPPDDPRHGGQWYLDTIDIHAAWEISTGDPSVVIGVVDDGCDLAHPDLADHMEPGRDLVDDDDDPSFFPGADGNEHGTACAGLVAAVGDNGVGIAGTCPECHLRCVRLLPGDRGGEVPLGNDIAAYEQQVVWGVAVSSNSWGFVDHFPVPSLLRAALEKLLHEGRGGKGAVVVFAAGNDAREVKDDELYGIDGIVTVGAINAFDELASFSNGGEPLDLVSPAGTLTTDISGREGADASDYTSLFGGTSSACPVVAGVAALLVAAAPDASGAEITAALIETTRPAPFALPDERGHDLQYGYGIVDPAAALARLVPPIEVEPTPEAVESVEVTPEPSAEATPDEDDAADGDAAETGDAGAEPSVGGGRDDGCAGATPIGLTPLVPLAFCARARARARRARARR